MPAMSCLAGASASSAAATMSETSASLPSPTSPQARRPVCGITKRMPSRAKRCDVFLRYRISPHVDVHGSCYKHRAVRGKQRSREAVICNSRCHLSQHVSGCGNNHHKVSPVDQEDVRNGRVRVGIEVVRHGMAETPSNVGVPTKRSASAVIVTRTSQPACCRPRMTSTAL